MVDNSPAPLTGTVEMDETYIGGKAKRRGGTKRNQKRVEDKFDMVVGIKERGGRLKFAHVRTVNKKTISAVVEANIDPNVENIYTDSSTAYDFALRWVFHCTKKKTAPMTTASIAKAMIRCSRTKSTESAPKRAVTA